MKKVVKAVQDLILKDVTIPKGSLGYRCRYSSRLQHHKSAESACVKFPEYWRLAFVAHYKEIIDI